MNRLWILYAAALVVAALTRMIERIVTEKGGFASRYALLIATVVIAAGIYGSVARKPIVARWLWQLTCAVMALSLVALTVLAVYLQAAFPEKALVFIAMIGAGICFLSPGIYKIWTYAFRSADVWTTAPKKYD